MIIDLTITNFRSIFESQMLSLNVESSQERLRENFSSIEGNKYSILRSAAILGPNASGKSNLLLALAALKWIVTNSGNLKEDESIPPYEPYKLNNIGPRSPVEFELEFVVPSGNRFSYKISFTEKNIVEESLHFFPNGQRALVFEKKRGDDWSVVKFGAKYKGGRKRFSFFENNSYLSVAGNNAASAPMMREIVRYFRGISFISPGAHIYISGFLKSTENLKAIANLISLADTGISDITIEENENANDLKFPDGMPDRLKKAFIERNRMQYQFWMHSEDGTPVEFDEEAMSDGTMRLFETLPLVLMALTHGLPIIIDEIDAHLHTHIMSLLLQLFHDHEINTKGAQIIFTTHDTNVLDSDVMRRDQIWFASKSGGQTLLRSLDEYDKKLVRPDSPFEAFYVDGRLGGLPNLSYPKIRETLIDAVKQNSSMYMEEIDA